MEPTASGQAGEAGPAVRMRTAKTGVRPEKMSKLIFPDCRRFSYARKLSLCRSSYRRKLFVIASKPVRRMLLCSFLHEESAESLCFFL